MIRKRKRNGKGNSAHGEKNESTGNYGIRFAFLHAAAGNVSGGRWTLHHACFDNDYMRAKILLEDQKVDPNEYNGWRCPAIFCAKSAGIADLLIKHGARTNESHGVGTLLHHSCSAEYPLELVLYYSMRLDVNSKQVSWGRTPLHVWAAISMYHDYPREEYAFVAQEKLKALLGAGANVLLTDKDGKTALDILIETRDARNAPAYKGFVEACNEHITLLTKAMEAQKWRANK